jgi:hypothetical protein
MCSPSPEGSFRPITSVRMYTDSRVVVADGPVALSNQLLTPRLLRAIYCRPLQPGRVLILMPGSLDPTRNGHNRLPLLDAAFFVPENASSGPQPVTSHGA